MSVTDADTTEPNPIHDLTGFQRDLLVAVADIEDSAIPSGQSVKERVMAQGYDKDQVQNGRLYPNLDVLENKGLIEKGEIDNRTNSYEPTELGAEFLAEYHATVSRVVSDD